MTIKIESSEHLRKLIDKMHKENKQSYLNLRNAGRIALDYQIDYHKGKAKPWEVFFGSCGEIDNLSEKQLKFLLEDRQLYAEI